MYPSTARVAARRIASEADALLDQLADLAALDGALTDIEESFASHYGRVASTRHPEVLSHYDALIKARNGLAIANVILEKAQEMVAAFPEDKTAKRAVADANTMVARFTRHVEEASKVIRTLAQKQMPPALKAAAAKLKTAVSKLLNDPSALQVRPWMQRENVRATVGAQEIETVRFFVQFEISGFTAYPDGVVCWLSEGPVGAGGVQFTVAKTGTVKEGGQTVPLTSIQTAVSLLKPILVKDPAPPKVTGKPAPPKKPGVTHVTSAELAEKVADIMTKAVRKHLNDSSKSAVVSRKKGTFAGGRAPLQVSLEFSSETGQYTRRDRDWWAAYGKGGYAGSYTEYQDKNKKEVENWRKVLVPLLAPYTGLITASIDWTLEGYITTTVIVGDPGIEVIDEDEDEYYD